MTAPSGAVFVCAAARLPRMRLAQLERARFPAAHRSASARRWCQGRPTRSDRGRPRRYVRRRSARHIATARRPATGTAPASARHGYGPPASATRDRAPCVKMSGSCTIRITGIVARDLGHGRRQIVGTAKPALPKRNRELIADSGEPEARAGLAEQNGIILHHRNAGTRSAQGGSRPHGTTSRDCRESRARRAALSAATVRRPRPAPEPARSRIVGGDEVAEQQDDVGAQRIRRYRRCRGCARRPILGPPACRSAITEMVSR